MSLLMDALKKAELAKRQTPGDSPAASPDVANEGELALEPMAEWDAAGAPATSEAATDPADAQALSLASHLEELDARFLAEAAAAARQKPTSSTAAMELSEVRSAPPAVESPSPRPAPTDSPARPPTAAAAPHRTAAESGAKPQDKAAAQNLFAAKQPEKPPSRKAFALAIGVVTVLSVLGIGGYFWWQLQPKNNLLARGPLPPVPRPAAPIAAPPPTAAAPTPGAVAAPSPLPAPASVPPTAPATAGAPAPATVGAARPAVTERDDDEPAASERAPRRPTQRRAAQRSADIPDEDSPIRVTRAPLKVNPSLTRGFDAFNRGELAVAQTEYERVRKSDPRNTDALHGLAAIALREGRLDQAELLYRQITDTDPQDTVALAALLNQRGQIDPNVTESRLKSLAAAQPELAAPHFSLGNLYARHGRWGEAQQAYFRAYSAEPDNPDIIYNLAISLEHLRQNKLAAQYYSQAITAAQNRPAGFDKAQAAARLQKLQP